MSDTREFEVAVGHAADAAMGVVAPNASKAFVAIVAWEPNTGRVRVSVSNFPVDQEMNAFNKVAHAALRDVLPDEPTEQSAPLGDIGPDSN